MMAQLIHLLIRPFSFAIGGFALSNQLGGLLRPGFDANLWWIDLRFWPSPLAAGFIFLFSLLLLHFSWQPVMGPWRRIATLLCIATALLVTAGNAWTYFHLQKQGWIDGAAPLPVSLFLAIAFMVMLYSAITSNRDQARRSQSRVAGFMVSAITFALLLLAFPLLQMFCFGTTSYARSVDAIIVPGARAYADGRPSVPLADRVRTACDLYHQGLSKVLIFSGGPGDGDIHETESMRLFAISLGVPDSAILLDPQGLSTQATVNHTLPMLDRIDATRIMVVSHSYHLPRLKLTYQREGREVFTVPAKESYTLRAMPIYLVREVAALWWYYVRPVVG